LLQQKKGDGSVVAVTFFATAKRKQKAMAVLLPLFSVLQQKKGMTALLSLPSSLRCNKTKTTLQ
jgi:hypothetical protein